MALSRMATTESGTLIVTKVWDLNRSIIKPSYSDSSHVYMLLSPVTSEIRPFPLFALRGDGMRSSGWSRWFRSRDTRRSERELVLRRRRRRRQTAEECDGIAFSGRDAAPSPQPLKNLSFTPVAGVVVIGEVRPLLETV